MFPTGPRGFSRARTQQSQDFCTGVSYGDYLGTKAIYSDGVTAYLRNFDFNYDHTVNGFTILAMVYGTAATWEDFGYYLSLNGSSDDVLATVGGTNLQVGAANVSYTQSVDVQTPNYVLISYAPDGMGGSRSYRSINGVGAESLNPIWTYNDWGVATESNILKRVGGGNRTKGYFGFLQIIDRPISDLCCDLWTSNAQARNIVGDFSDVLMLNIENGVYDDGGTDSIEDISGNGFHWELSGFTANELDDTHPDYFLKSIP